MNFTRIPCFQFILIALAGVVLTACDEGAGYHGQRADDILQSTTAKEFNQIDPSDVVLGDTQAPLTLFIYSSYTCPACGFLQRDVVPLLRRDFVNSGAINIVFRDHPWDSPSLQVSSVAQCIPNEMNYYNFMFDAFAAQSQWKNDPQFLDQIAEIAAPYGLSASKVRSCATDPDITGFITARQRVAGQTLGICCTPSVYLGAQPVPTDYASLSARIRSAL